MSDADIEDCIVAVVVGVPLSLTQFGSSSRSVSVTLDEVFVVVVL